MNVRRRTRGAVARMVCIMVLSGAGAFARDEAPAARRAGDEASRFCANQLHGELWARTELYFGLSRAGGPDITDEEFAAFVDTVVTPRFPDGLTLLSGDGQFRGVGGVVVKESSRVLILFYPWTGRRNRAVDRIRELYKEAFEQQAVLRVDGTSCVSF